MQYLVRLSPARVVTTLIVTGLLFAVLSIASPAAHAATCDVVDASAGWVSADRYTYHGYAVGCTRGVNYDWRLTVETKQGAFVRTHTGTRYNAPSGWSTSDYYYFGTGAYCVTFRVRQRSNGNIMGSGTDCT